MQELNFFHILRHLILIVHIMMNMFGQGYQTRKKYHNPLTLDFSKMKGLMGSPIVIDLRNIYGPERMRELGFDYTGVGR